MVVKNKSLLLTQPALTMHRSDVSCAMAIEHSSTHTQESLDKQSRDPRDKNPSLDTLPGRMLCTAVNRADGVCTVLSKGI
jgi:hypothetical protein